MENNTKNLEDAKAAIEKLGAGLFATVDKMGDRLTPEQKNNFAAQKQDISDKMSKFTDVSDLLKDLQNKANF